MGREGLLRCYCETSKMQKVYLRSYSLCNLQMLFSQKESIPPEVNLSCWVMSGKAVPLLPSCGFHPSSKHTSKEVSSIQNKPPKQRTNRKKENEGASRPTTALSGRRCATVAVDEQFLFLNQGGKIHFSESRKRKPNIKYIEEACHKF